MSEPTYQERVDAMKTPPDLKERTADPPPRPLIDVPETESRIRPETTIGLENLAEAIVQQQQDEAGEVTAETAKDDDDDADDTPLDLATLWGSLDPLQNPKRKKLIESRLDELKLEDLLMKREIRQRVPIIPGKFEVSFRTLETHEDLFLKRLLFSDDDVSGRYAVDRMSVLTVAAGLVAINDDILPDHVEEAQDGTRTINKAIFDKKVQQVDRLPVQLLSDMSVNYQWFDERVRALFTEENLKNG